MKITAKNCILALVRQGGIIPITEWTDGKRLDAYGDLADSSTAAVSGFIPVNAFANYSIDGGVSKSSSWCYCFYNADKVFLGAQAQKTSSSSDMLPEELIPIEGTRFIRITSDINHSFVLRSDYSQDPVRGMAFTKTIGTYLNADGVEVESQYAAISDFIPVNTTDTFEFRGTTSATWYQCYYSSDSTFISSERLTTSSSESVIKNLTIPDGAKYVRLSLSKASGLLIKRSKSN